MTIAGDRAMFDQAAAVLQENDRGGYTVPTKGLYPFQWNWDSCLTALGQQRIDERRAWTEIETLLEHQWPDGMVPHIIFHVDDEGYFPGPRVWNTGRPTPTSGITQPPVLGFVLRRLFERARDRGLAREKAAALAAKAEAWHRWFYSARDPAGTGLVAILHPWESGRDNSIDWDAALARVPTEGVDPYRRRDTQHVNPAERPTKAEYDRYLYLVQLFRDLRWDEDLAALAEELGFSALAAAARRRAMHARNAFDMLWSAEAGQHLAFDRVAGALVDSASVGGVLPLLAALGGTVEQSRIIATMRAWRSCARFGVPSHDPADPRFDSKRYWRGPCWLIVNYLIVDGLRRIGEAEAAREVIADSLALIRESGFAEYYDPLDGKACGGGSFTWTAAMVIEFLAMAEG
jgi:glycogen debranching enzyme